MGKVIFWLVVFFLVLLALRMVSVHKSRRESEHSGTDRTRNKRDNVGADEAMVRCTGCGVYIPKSQAILDKTGFVCGNAQCDQRSKKS